MTSIDRRSFIGRSVGTLSAVGLAGGWYSSHALSQDDKTKDKSSVEERSLETLFLTWQGDPTTTMTVQWIDYSSASEIPVHYGLLDGSNMSQVRALPKPYPGTEQRVFRAELKGLTPGTEYQFRVGISLNGYRFRTMPSKITDEFRFITGGDSGIGKNAEATNKLAALQDPNFIFLGGDLAYDNGTSPVTFTKFLKNYSATMYDSSHRMIPLISCIGNHEVTGSYNAPREKCPQYLSVFDGLYAERTYGTLDFGDYLSLVLLDTNHIEPVAGEQTSWLEKVLAERQEIPHLFAANHVPAYPSYRAPEGADGKPGTGHDQRKHWAPLFERYKVDAVLEHHDHTFKRSHPLTGGLRDKNGVVYMGDGSWGKLRAPKSPEERPYLAKSAMAYHLSVHSLQGESRFHLAMEETGRIADFYATHKKRPSRRG